MSLLDVFLLVCGGVLLIKGLYTDIKVGQIKNVDTILFIIIGFFINFLVREGIDVNYLLYFLLMFVIVFVVYFIRIIGAGDAKLLWAIGALFGFNVFVNVFIYAILTGGLYQLIHKIIGQSGFESMFIYFKDLFVSFLFLKQSPSKINKNESVTFAIFIVLGVILTLIVPITAII